MKWLHIISYTLVVVGALNWGLVALLNFNLVTWLAVIVGISGLESIVYILVGASAVYEVLTHGGRCKECMSMMKK